MNHCVPDFHEMEDDDSIPTHSSFSRQKRPPTGEEEIMELLWQNGQVVVQSQNQRPSKKSAFGSSGEVVLPTEREIRSTAEEQPPHLFMQEDEMVSWLQYPLDDSSFDRDFYTDLLYSAPPPPALVPPTAQPRAVAEIRPPPPPPPPPRPPIQPPVARPDNPPRVHNFVHFSRLPIRPRTEAVSSVSTARESTIVDSNETPAVRPESRVSHMVADGTPPLNEDSATAKGGSTSAAAGDLTAGTCDLTLTSSPGGSRTSFSEATRQPHQKPPAAAAEDRKRKAREADDTEYQNEDIKFEAKKQARGSASTKRSRAAEVHNLSERRRRDRINEKMRALQELIPHCNKSDKASMLDEAIEYLKSLQLQVQMMSMGCGMVPMIYPGMQPYMPAMGLGMGMEMAMNRPMVPYPSMMPGSAAAAAAHMPPRFPLPPFHMPSTNQLDNSITPHNQNQPRLPNYADPYQEYHLGFHHRQLPVPHNQGVVQPNADKPSTSKDIDNPDNHPTG